MVYPLQDVAATSDGSETRGEFDARDADLGVDVRSGREETHAPAGGTGDGVAFGVAETTELIVGEPFRQAELWEGTAKEGKKKHGRLLAVSLNVENRDGTARRDLHTTRTETLHAIRAAKRRHQNPRHCRPCVIRGPQTP